MTLPESLRLELERMSALLKPDPAAFEARKAMHELHVLAFVDQLRPAVRKALEEEGQAEVAGDWIEDARQTIVRWLALPANVHETSTLDAERQLQEALTDDLVAEAAKPTDEEVEDHATELAQLLLSNWFAMLEHALQDQGGELLALDFDALPLRARPAEVLQGCEAFALPALAAATALRDYQRSLMQDNSIVALSPTLHLLRARGEWRVARTRQRAEAALQQQTRAQPMQEGRRRFEAVLQVLRPWALARPMDLLGVRAVATAALTLEAEQRIAFEAALWVSREHDDDEWSAFGDSGQLVKDLAEQVITDLGDAASAGQRVLMQTWRAPKHLQEVLLFGEHELEMFDAGSVYRTALSTTGLVIAADPLPTEPDDRAPRIHGDLEAVVFKYCVGTAKRALAEADQVTLRRGIRRAAGIDMVAPDEWMGI